MKTAVHPRSIVIVFRRELAAYFATPLAYVFILIFLVLASWFTFYLGDFSNAARPTWSRSSYFIPGCTCS